MNVHKTIGSFFEDQWSLYQKAIRGNVLCHEQMFGALDRFLNDRFGNQPFSFADFGCGDSSAVLDTLQNKNLNHYIGVDAAADLIRKASETLEPLQCQKTLICDDMAAAIKNLEFSADVIFCSYSLHHLSQQQKTEFIENCYAHLNTPGFFIMIDGVLMDGETREGWLKRLEQRFLTLVPGFTAEDTAQIMQHPREYDMPESISTFRNIAQRSAWRSCDVLIERDDFLTLMVFTK